MIDEKMELPALTEDWFTRPYEELLAEATRVGALVGPSEHAIQWSPDTCESGECKLDLVTHGVLVREINNKGQVREVFVADPSQDVTAGQTHSLCPFHAHLTNPKEHFDTVLGENQLKNMFENDYLLNVPEVWEEIPRSLAAMTEVWRRTITAINAQQPLKEKLLLEGLTQKVYREGKSYKWSFDAKRNLVIDATGLTPDSLYNLGVVVTGSKYSGRVIIRG